MSDVLNVNASENVKSDNYFKALIDLNLVL